MKKILCFTIGAIIFSSQTPAWGKKNAEYYFEHPTEANAIFSECKSKIDNVDFNNDKLLEIKEEKSCIEAMIAINAIQLGDIKKAILVDDKKGWGAFVDSIIKKNEKIATDLILLDEIEKLPMKEGKQKVTSAFFKCPVIKLKISKDMPAKEICDRVGYIYLREKFESLENIQKNYEKISPSERYITMSRVVNNCGISTHLNDKALTELCEKAIPIYKKTEAERK